MAQGSNVLPLTAAEVPGRARSPRQPPALAAEDVLPKQRARRASATPGLLGGEVYIKWFHGTEHTEDLRRISPHPCSSRRGHTYRPAPKSLRGPGFPRTWSLPGDAPSGRANRDQLPHLLPSPGPGFKIFVEGREEVGERRS